MTKAELLKIATDMNITGRWDMSKQQLIFAIDAAKKPGPASRMVPYDSAQMPLPAPKPEPKTTARGRKEKTWSREGYVLPDTSKLPKQAQVIAACVVTYDKDEFTMQELADYAVVCGLKTKQDPKRIVAYYMSELKAAGLVSK